MIYYYKQPTLSKQYKSIYPIAYMTSISDVAYV